MIIIDTYVYWQGQVWGVVYKVPNKDVNEVRKYLGWREKAGYEVSTALFYPKDSRKEPFEVEVIEKIEIICFCRP